MVINAITFDETGDFMLGIWRTHASYQKFMVEAVNREFKHNPKAIANHEAAVLKMYYLNLDIIKDDFLPLFSITGKPSNQQPELFRSLLLMSHYKHMFHAVSFFRLPS